MLTLGFAPSTLCSWTIRLAYPLSFQPRLVNDFCEFNHDWVFLSGKLLRNRIISSAFTLRAALRRRQAEMTKQSSGGRRSVLSSVPAEEAARRNGIYGPAQASCLNASLPGSWAPVKQPAGGKAARWTHGHGCWPGGARARTVDGRMGIPAGRIPGTSYRRGAACPCI